LLQDQITAKERALSKKFYRYRSYNPTSMLLYAERYAWFVASLPFVITNRRTAVTRSLTRRLKRGCATRSNPTDIADELAERKSEVFHTLLLSVYGMHDWVRQRSRTNGGQLSMENFTMTDPYIITREQLGICPSGHALVRRFFSGDTAASREYQFSFRQQNVTCRIGAVDGHMKAFSGLSDWSILNTLWSNEVNAPVLSVNCSTTSMDDPAFAAGAAAHNAVVQALGLERMEYLWCDNVNRDERGCCRRFPSLNLPLGGAAAVDYISTDATEWTSISAANRNDLVPLLGRFAAITTLGFDLEWRAAQRTGDSPGDVATIQLYGK
jgi:hypothetical protein